MIRLGVILASIFLYPLGYWICDLVYYSDINKWHLLRYSLYMVNMSLLVFAFTLPQKTERLIFIEKMLLISFLWWVLIPSVLGHIQNETTVTILDVISLVIGLILFFKEISDYGRTI